MLTDLGVLALLTALILGGVIAARRYGGRLAPWLVARLPFMNAAAWRRRMWRRAYRRAKKRRAQYLERRKRHYEKARRILTENPRFRSVEEYAADAQKDRVLLRFGGRTVPGAPTAMQHRDVLKRRYDRTIQFAGKAENLGVVLIYAAAVVLAIIGFVGGWLYESEIYDPLKSKPGEPLMFGGIGVVLGGIGGFFSLYTLVIRRWWKVSHTQVHFVEHSDLAAPWRLTAVGRVWLVRLGFAARDHGRIFSGGAHRSGILEGNVIVELPAGKTAAECLGHVRDVYELAKKRGRFSGESTRAIDGRVAKVAALAKRRRELAPKTAMEWLDRVGPWAVTAICVIITFLSMGGSQ